MGCPTGVKPWGQAVRRVRGKRNWEAFLGLRAGHSARSAISPPSCIRPPDGRALAVYGSGELQRDPCPAPLEQVRPGPPPDDGGVAGVHGRDCPASGALSVRCQFGLSGLQRSSASKSSLVHFSTPTMLSAPRLGQGLRGSFLGVRQLVFDEALQNRRALGAAEPVAVNEPCRPAAHLIWLERRHPNPAPQARYCRQTASECPQGPRMSSR